MGPLLLAAALLGCGGCRQEHSKAVEVAGNYVCVQSNLDNVECFLYEGLEVTPAKEPIFDAYAQLAGGRWFFCGLTQSGEIDCWGSTTYNKTEPIPVGPFAQLRVGMSEGCGIRADRSATCWGTLAERVNDFDPGTQWHSFAMGDSQVCAIADGPGPVVCWGRDWHNAGSLSPPDGQWDEVWGGGDFMAARAVDGTFAMWGNNQDGQLNHPPNPEFTDIALAFDHSCVLSPQGEAICWGSNDWGQLDPPAGETFVDIDARGRFTCGLTPDHRLLCWGCYSDKLYDPGHEWCQTPIPSWDR